MLSHTNGAVALAIILIAAPPAAHADVVLDWNAIMLATTSGNASDQIRVAAITHLAVFEAVNAITGDYTPYLGTVTAPTGGSTEAAAVAAAHRVLTHYVPDQTPTLDQQRAASLATIPDGPAKDDGIAVGVAAADALIALREHDGTQPPRFHLPSSTAPGVWQLTPSCTPAGGVLLQWRDVTPFGIRAGDQFRAAPPPPLWSGKYRRDLEEVRSLGAADSAHRPPDRANVARFYAAVLSTPLWNMIAAQITTAQGRSLSENARAFALLNLAIGDAVIAVFDSKYHYTFWRPETAVGEFTPFITTPCHPSYPSAHAAAGNAAREVLTRIFGRAGHSIDLSVAALPDVTLHYSSLSEITADIDDARVFGGIHFPFDQRAGARQGRRVGAFVYKHQLRPIHFCDLGDETEEADDTDEDIEGDR